MCFHVGAIRELMRKEHSRIESALRFGPLDASAKASLIAADRHDVCAEAGDKGHPLPAHPIGHEDGHRVTERPPDCGKRDTGIAARGLSDAIARSYPTVAIGILQHKERHSILDAAGEAERLVLSVDTAHPPAVTHVDGQHRCVADEPMQRAELRGDLWRRSRESQRDLQLPPWGVRASLVVTAFKALPRKPCRLQSGGDNLEMARNCRTANGEPRVFTIP